MNALPTGGVARNFGRAMLALFNTTRSKAEAIAREFGGVAVTMRQAVASKVGRES
jgi:hypothetical protein